MRISDEIIQRVKEENDVVDVISEVVKLKRAGRNYMGLCPFHREKSPSFSVSVDKQIYKCFGCGESGNVFTFVMKNRNIDFVEAVKYLANRANITIEYDDYKTRVLEDQKERLYSVNVEAARFFYSNLLRSKKSQEYFSARGISVSTVKRFGLGFAPDSWHDLMNALKRKGFSELDMLNVGLVIKSEKGNIYDRFRNRVMFPVFDYRGKVIGFGGRVLDDSKPKYLNSPESLIFQKGTNLYGLNFALKHNNNRTFIIVEGYMDCISLHQHGITNAVASLGTALTVQQAKLLKRYGDKIVISYDADAAGQAATIRGLEILRKEGFDVKVLTVPSGKDPDEFIRANGKEAFLRLVENALPLMDYKIKKAAEGLNFNDSEEVIKYVKKVTESLADLNPVEKDVYISKISQQTGIKEQAIYDLLKGELSKSNEAAYTMNSMPAFGQKLYVEPAHIKAERILLKLMHVDEECFEFIKQNLSEEMFILNGHKKIYKLLLESKYLENIDKARYVEDRCDDVESSKEWVEINNLELLKDDYENKQLIIDYINEIKRYQLENLKKQIKAKISECEAKGLIEESLKLAQRLMEIKREVERS
ncbi:DNA primase [Clostridium thermarum]|uniref:DNA primase n=1 Tax=Clostridium thermarum TaxID=1716543 RepID=UPI00111D5A49|nr:DNA primase [Clostridium thermarum]